jgi:hypothetical protein
MFYLENSSLVREQAGEKLVIEPYGKDGPRVRSTMCPTFQGEDWALLHGVRPDSPDISIRSPQVTSPLRSLRITRR